MTTLHRALLAVLFAAWLAMPSIGDEGGDNASGGGVWILPCAAVIDETAMESGGAVRALLAAQAITGDIRMQVAANMGSPAAVLVTTVSSDPVPLAVCGATIVISRDLLQALASAKVDGQIVITDASQQGYVIDLVINAASGTVALSVR